MENYKLVELTDNLTGTEINRFRKYLSSPFFNENESLLTLFDLMTSAKDGLSKDNIYQALYNGESYDDLKLRHLQSDLSKKMEEFLALTIYQKRVVESKLDSLRAYRERNLDKHFNGVLRLTSKHQENNIHRDGNFFYDQFQLENEINKYVMKKYQRSQELNLQKAASTLDTFYIINKLKNCCEQLNYGNVVNIDSELLLMEEIINHVRNKEYGDVPAIEIYYQILMTLTEEENEDHFYKLKSLLDIHIEKFTVEESKDMFAFAQNYCIKQINKGNVNYHKEIFELYKKGIGKAIIFENGKISPFDFKNIVTVGCRLNEFKWVKSFIVKYKEKIDPEFRENAYTYNLAKYYFSLQKYDRVLRLLQEVEYDDVFYGMDSRTMLLKTYYEVDEIVSLDYLIDSFRVYLKRNKLISDDHRTNYLNLIKYVRRLAKAKAGRTKNLRKLKNDIKYARHVADVAWLREKADELKMRNDSY